jgi:metal-responsive CopG/Arc/MetJ family transcriptional regulator
MFINNHNILSLERLNQMQYTRIGVPTVLADRIKTLMEKSTRGYRTLSEFIMEAARDKLEREEQEITAIQESAKV